MSFSRITLTALAGSLLLPVTAVADDADHLLHMRNEEKLARDVYLQLHEVWGAGIFANIADSEQQHMDVVLSLLEAEGLEDPVAGLDIGEYSEVEVAALYVELVDYGSSSLEAGLEVGALIEDLDIWDLDQIADGDPVLESIRCASGDHLRAFVGALEERGLDYEPEYLSVERYEEVLDDADATCETTRFNR